MAQRPNPERFDVSVGTEKKAIDSSGVQPHGS